jgi:photosystem II stability/assembly factor-like uncharacterized protein
MSTTLRRRAVCAALLAVAALPATAGAAVPDTWARWAVAGPERDSWVRSLDATGPGQMVAGTEGDGTFASATAGLAWTADGAGLSGTARSVRQVVAAGGRQYAATSAGLFSRSAAGGTWTPLGQGEGPGKLNLPVQALRVDGPVIVAGTASAGIWRSADAGQTWAQAQLATPNESIWWIAAPAVGGTPLYAAGGSGVYRSLDGGSSWHRRSDGIPFAQARRVVVDPVNPLLLYAATSAGVYRSSTGGETWTPAGGEGPTALGSTNAHAMLLAPSGFGAGGRFVVGTDQGVWASKDGGTTWGRMATTTAAGEAPVGGQEVWSLSYDPVANPVALVAGTKAKGVHTLPLQPIQAATPPVPPAVTDATPTVGQVLEAAQGLWAGTKPFVLAARWQRCAASGSGCTDIPGATGPAYAVRAADLDDRLRVVVTGGNLVRPGTIEQASEPTGPVESTPADAPSPPGGGFPKVGPIDGSKPWGTTYTVQTGTWSPAGAAFSIRWERCSATHDDCAPIPGATGPTYTSRQGDVNGTLRAQVTGTRLGASRTVVTGTAPAVIERTPVNTAAPAGRRRRPRGRRARLERRRVGRGRRGVRAHVAALRLRRPRVLADPGCEGVDVHADGGRPRPAAAPARDRDRRGPVPGAHGDDGQPGDAGDHRSPRAPGGRRGRRRRGGRAAAAARAAAGAPAARAAAAAARAAAAASRVVRLSAPRRVRVGSRLAAPARIAGATSVRYQWLRDGRAIRGQTRRTYRVVRGDRGRRLTCRLRIRRADGTTVRITSTAVRVPRGR